MANMNILSDLKIKKSKAKEKPYILTDGYGLQLLIKPNEHKLWEFRFKSPTTLKTRKTSFGLYPQVSLLNARKKRDTFFDLIAQEIDPIDYLKQEKIEILKDKDGQAIDVVYEWLEKESLSTKENTHKGKVRVFENDVIPFFRNKHINDIDIPDIVELLEIKHLQAPEIASRLFNYLDNLFRYAVLKRYCTRNIMSDIRKSDLIKPRTAKHMPKITNEKILAELIDSIYNYKGGHSVKNALKLVLHIPLRAENLCKLKWEQIDFEENTITIPREFMKLKNINLDSFVMPISSEAMNIINEQKVYTQHQQYVFLGTDFKSFINKESPNRALERMGFNDEKRGRKIRLHGFRGTFRSLSDTLDLEGKFSFEVKERALDHHDKNLVVRAYTNKANYLIQLRELMNWWSEYLMSLKTN